MSSSDHRATGPPVFIPQKHPELRQLGRKSIHIFLQERNRYLLRTDDAIAQGSSFKPVSLVSSVNFDLLTSLIKFRTFDGVESIADLNDEVLLRWLKDKATPPLETIRPENLLLMVKKSVYMKVNEPDPWLRVMSLFTDYATFIREKRLESLMGDNPKVAVEHICSLLRPPALKQKIENDIALHKSGLRKNFHEFMEHVLQKAVALEEFLTCTDMSGTADSMHSEKTQSYKSKSVRGKTSTQNVNSDGGYSADTKRSTTKNLNTELPSESVSSKIKSGDGKAVNLKPFCLNKAACPGERHFMSDCTKTPAEKKKELLQEYHRAKKTANGAINRVRTHEDEEVPNSTTNGRIPATLADTVEVTVSGDYGADHAALCEAHLTSLANANVYVAVLPLSKPITMELAVNAHNEPVTVTASKKARISTTLATAEGPFRLRNVEYLVFAESMPEVLLSRPILQSLGFNLDAHLARLRKAHEDVDCSNIGFLPEPAILDLTSEGQGKLSGMLKSGTTDGGTVSQR